MQKALLMGQKDGQLRQAQLDGKLDLCASGSTWYPTLTFCPLVFVVSATECKRAFKLGLTSNAVLHEALFNDPHFHFHVGQIDHTEGGRGALVESGVEKIVQCFIHLKRKLRAQQLYENFELEYLGKYELEMYSQVKENHIVIFFCIVSIL